MKVLLIVAVVLVVGLMALTLAGAVVGLAWECLCRTVPIVMFCPMEQVGVAGVEWLIGRVAGHRAGSKGGEPRARETPMETFAWATWFFKVGVGRR